MTSGDDIKAVQEECKTKHPNDMPLITEIPKETVML